MPESVRDFADKVMRDALLKPDNLRDLLSRTVPDLLGGFDCARAQPYPTEFLLPDGRGREADLLFEIPYRLGDEEKLALVCVLIEHQTRPDLRMALRTLLYIVLYWEKKWWEWERQPAPKPEFSLPPVLPIVFHTGTQPWGSARSLSELLVEPSAFHAFAPTWAPLFWELPKHSVEELLSAEEAFLQALAVVRVDDADRDEFAKVYRATLDRLNSTQASNRSRWSDLVYLIVGWLLHRRPKSDQPELIEATRQLAPDLERREEIDKMVETYADVVFAEGERKGERKGRAAQAREILLLLSAKRLGAASPEIEAAVNAISDLDRLKRMLNRSDEVSTWAQLLATL